MHWLVSMLYKILKIQLPICVEIEMCLELWLKAYLGDYVTCQGSVYDNLFMC